MTDRDDWKLLRDAIAFARRRHAGQLRKDGETPYFDHLVRVMALVQTESPPPAVLCAALLHDTIEDTATSYDDLRDAFGHPVAELVVWLSEDKRRPRAERKKAFHDSVAQLPRWAQVIKLADLLDNLYDLEGNYLIPLNKRIKQLERSAGVVELVAPSAPRLADQARTQIAQLRGMLEAESAQ